MTSPHRQRCAWAEGDDALMARYHDEEWGVPQHDDRVLFEFLTLEGAQAGLSWITILRKRDNFRAAFDGFQPEAIVRYGPDKVAALMGDAGIIRNRAKIESTVKSARAWLNIMEKGSFSAFLWDHLDGRPRQNAFRARAEVPAETETAKGMSKALKAAGFNFCGPTIVYAFMQAVGMVNDHLVGCYRHEECRQLAAKL